MINTAMSFVLDQLNNYLDAQLSGQERAAVLSGLVDASGGTPSAIENKMVLSLVNVERETVIGSTGFVGQAGSAYAKTNPALYINLYVLVTASYPNNYTGALKMLSLTMGFMQARQWFDAQNSTGFPADMAQLTMELVSQDLAELSTLWAMLGANYMPSALYKLRMLTMQQGWVIHPIPAVQSSTPNLGQGS